MIDVYRNLAYGCFFFFQAEDGIRDYKVTGVQTCLFFFFSSRRRHTRLQGDWSSDVCLIERLRDLARSLQSLLVDLFERAGIGKLAEERPNALSHSAQSVRQLVLARGWLDPLEVRQGPDQFDRGLIDYGLRPLVRLPLEALDHFRPHAADRDGQVLGAPASEIGVHLRLGLLRITF